MEEYFRQTVYSAKWKILFRNSKINYYDIPKYLVSTSMFFKQHPFDKKTFY